MTFNIKMYSDGVPNKYGNVTGASLEEAVEELMYYDDISAKWDEDELTQLLTNMKPGFQNYKRLGSSYWQEFRVTKNL